MSERKRHIQARFGRAAESYDHAAKLQALVAVQLAEYLAALDWPVHPRVLELGCGTGNLTHALWTRMPDAHWIASDIAAAMVLKCRQRCPQAACVVMDAEQPSVSGPFDLIVSNLVFQWLVDLPACLARLGSLLAPGGRLAFTTLGPQTFKEWRAAHHALELRVVEPDYPALAAFPELLPDGFEIESSWQQCLIETHPDALDFLKSLKCIGADLPAGAMRPLPPGTLRRLLRAIDAGGPTRVTYQVLSVVLRRR